MFAIRSNPLNLQGTTTSKKWCLMKADYLGQLEVDPNDLSRNVEHGIDDEDEI